MAIIDAVDDVYGGMMNWRLWGRLGWYDIRNRYRRSYFGPLWTALTTGFFVAALGSLYTTLFDRDPAVYIPHLTLGFMAWTLMSMNIIGSCRAFIGSQGFILETRLPLSTFVFRALWQNSVTFCYQLIVFAVVAVIYDLHFGFASILVVPGLALILLNSIWVGLIMGAVAARFRDVSEIVSSVLRVFFFMTPVIWLPDMIGLRTAYLEFNPFYHFMELFRAPMLNNTPQTIAWVVAIGFAVVGWPLALLLFAKTKDRVAYWL